MSASVAAIVSELRTSHAATTQGNWGKGKTTHHTAAKRKAGQPYHVAEFRHADDAQFCDLAHAHVPKLCDEVLRLNAQCLLLEAERDELLAALRGLDEAYCRAGALLNREERTEDRKRLIAARAAIAKHQPTTAVQPTANKS